MTEQQADALMGWIEVLTAPLLGEPELYKDQLDGFTALCRHRDEILYSRILWYLPLEEVKRFHDMQTWDDK